VPLRGDDFPSPASTSAPAPIVSCSSSIIVSSVLDEIAPTTVIRHIIDDWFDVIHSVCPIYHHANFLRRLENGDTTRDPVRMCTAENIVLNILITIHFVPSYTKF
jgi:hypothetical protein